MAECSATQLSSKQPAEAPNAMSKALRGAARSIRPISNTTMPPAMLAASGAGISRTASPRLRAA